MIGSQAPTHRTVPDYVASSGPEVVQLSRMAGLELDEWQQETLTDGLGEAADGSWAAFEVAEILSRQNGKGAVFEARELGGLYLLHEELILHTAHEFKTAVEAFKRIEYLVSNTAELRRHVKRIDRTRGEEGIELLPTATIITGSGSRNVRPSKSPRLRFIARSKGSGRGFTGDCVILDEAYELGDDQMAALLPTLSARPNPQLWYGSSAGMRTSVQLGRIWRRGRAACACEVCTEARDGAEAVPDPSLALVEWAAELCNEDCTAGCAEHDKPADPDVWAKTNPGLGIRISVEHIAREFATMSLETFCRERLGVGEYPAESTEPWQLSTEEQWNDGLDEASTLADPVAFGVAVSWDRKFAAIAAGGRRPDGLRHVEIVEHRTGTGWIVERVKGLRKSHKPCAVVVDRTGPASSLVPELEAAGVEVLEPTAQDAAQAYGMFIDSVAGADISARDLRHRAEPALTVALAAATKRPLGNAHALERKTDNDMSPLEAAMLALWGHATNGHQTGPVELAGSLMA